MFSILICKTQYLLGPIGTNKKQQKSEAENICLIFILWIINNMWKSVTIHGLVSCWMFHSTSNVSEQYAKDGRIVDQVLAGSIGFSSSVSGFSDAWILAWMWRDSALPVYSIVRKRQHIGADKSIFRTIRSGKFITDFLWLVLGSWYELECGCKSSDWKKRNIECWFGIYWNM